MNQISLYRQNKKYDLKIIRKLEFKKEIYFIIAHSENISVFIQLRILFLNCHSVLKVIKVIPKVQ